MQPRRRQPNSHRARRQPCTAALTRLQADFRLWALLPRHITRISLEVRPDDDRGEIVASVERPTFPPGVCTGCGCVEFDACVDRIGRPCHWIDRRHTRCSACGRPRRKAAA